MSRIMPQVSFKAAQTNMDELVRLASTGNNKGDIHFGVLKSTSGETRIVKFDAKGAPLTPAMLKSISDLKSAIASWEKALVGPDPKQGLQNRQIALALSQSENLSAKDLKNAIKDALKSDTRVYENAPSANAKPLGFEETLKALDSHVEYKSDLGNAVAKAVRSRSKRSEFFSSVGRKIMTATHAVKAFFTGKMFKSGWRDTVETFAKVASGKTTFTELPERRDEAPLDFDPHAVASSCGLKGRVTLSTMTDLRYDGGKKCIYPSGSPNIRDIRQDPTLQDCWFLASVASLLHSQGPDAITRLITVSDDQTTATVRLGRDRYTVPLADVMVDGRRAVSKSAPWVRILEQAMSMHLTTNVRDTVVRDSNFNQMSFRPADTALSALLGYAPEEVLEGVKGGGYVVNHSTHLSPVATLENLNELVNTKRSTVVLGHLGILSAMGSGVSPDHLVAVLSVDAKKGRVTILDPYGHPRHLSKSELSNFRITKFSEDDENNAQITKRARKEAHKAAMPSRDPKVLKAEREAFVAQMEASLNKQPKVEKEVSGFSVVGDEHRADPENGMGGSGQ